MHQNQSIQRRTYKLFKTQHRLEQYLTEREPRHSVPLCKFRLSNHKLPVVTGRFNQTPYEGRLCTLCEQKSIGNEWHCVYSCPYFSKLRKQYLNLEYHNCARQNNETNSPFKIRRHARVNESSHFCNWNNEQFQKQIKFTKNNAEPNGWLGIIN